MSEHTPLPPDRKGEVTPLPWESMDLLRCKCKYGIFHTHQPAEGALVYLPARSSAQDDLVQVAATWNKKTAAYIVKAANLAPKLVEVLETVEELTHRTTGSPNMVRVGDVVRAALAEWKESK